MSVKTSFSFVASFSSRAYESCTLQCCEAPSGPAERQDGLPDTGGSCFQKHNALECLDDNYNGPVISSRLFCVLMWFK